jgi:hypothetical protein
MGKFRQVLLLPVLLWAAAATAQTVVPTGASLALNGGGLDLAGTGLQISGLFSVAGGSVDNAANIAIAAGGALDGGSGQIAVLGDWSNAGSFLAGGSTVDFVDGAASSQISGSTSFANASFVSSTGKNYIFAVGSTQTISGLLTINGTAAQPIQFRSTSAGQVANIDLLAGGSQNIADVGVSDVHATGQHLAPTLTNDGGTGNALGWFAAVSGGGGNSGGTKVGTVAAPALSPWACLLLGLALAGLVLRRHSRQSFVRD